MKKKILFFHYDLKGGGAERVLINLLQHLDYTKYDVTLKTIFGAGPHVKNIPKEVKFKYLFRYEFYGFNLVMKLLPPRFWHWLLIKDKYDIEIGYLENAPTRIVSACPNKETKKVSWLHIEINERRTMFIGYRNEKEMLDCFNKLDHLVFVAKRTQECFEKLFPEVKLPMSVIHNVNDFDRIYRLAEQESPIELSPSDLKICAVNKLTKTKGFHRLIAACSKLKQEGLMEDVKIYILGKGIEKFALKQAIDKADLNNHIKLMGFDPNPYRTLSKMDLFVCTSYREGYSTAVTEAVALGVPVFTTDCSGMEEILEDGKFGMIVPNKDNAIYEGLKDLLTHREKIKQYADAISQAPRMTTQRLVDEYEKFFDSL